ncbi:MAG: class I SAM-dependent methyltransferase [Nitriliruptorales bacterium]|nr:class I SAM-dependent methyltransferase [Nitriliruptorales bacterium]
MTQSSWRDHADQPVERSAPPGTTEPPFYEAIGDFQGELYDRNVFASGTVAEVDVLVDSLALAAGSRVLDLGCGTGRHLRELAKRGIGGLGLDASPRLVAAARRAESPGVFFEVADVREPLDVEGFDAAVCLCHGGLGTGAASDPAVVANLARAVRPGGRAAFTVFHALFAARHLAPGDAFDTMSLTHHQPAEVRGPDDERRRFELWTSAYTVPGAIRLANDAGLDVVSVVGVEPGRYRPVDRDAPVRLDDPELLVLAERPGGRVSS